MRFGNIVVSTLALSAGVSAVDKKISFGHHVSGNHESKLSPKQIETKEKLESLLKDVDIKKLKSSSSNHVVDATEIKTVKKSLSKVAKSPKDVLKLTKKTTIDESHRHLATSHYKNNFLVAEISESCYSSYDVVKYGWLVNFCYELEDSSYVLKVNRGQNHAVYIAYENTKCSGVPSAVYDIFERGNYGFDTCFDTYDDGAYTYKYLTELPSDLTSGMAYTLSESDVCANLTPYFYAWQSAYYCFSNDDGTSYAIASYYCADYGYSVIFNFYETAWCDGGYELEFVSDSECGYFDGGEDDEPDLQYLPDSAVATYCFE